MPREARSRAAKPYERSAVSRCRRVPFTALEVRPSPRQRMFRNECSAETGAYERPLIAVSAGNFNTVNKYPSVNRHLLFRIKNRLC